VNVSVTSLAVKDEYSYWVYIVASVTGTLYTGSQDKVKGREHRANSLNLHGGASIFGFLSRCRMRSASLGMTVGKGVSVATPSGHALLLRLIA
jgi:hypothetical protein